MCRDFPGTWALGANSSDLQGTDAAVQGQHLGRLHDLDKLAAVLAHRPPVLCRAVLCCAAGALGSDGERVLPLLRLPSRRLHVAG